MERTFSWEGKVLIEIDQLADEVIESKEYSYD